MRKKAMSVLGAAVAFFCIGGATAQASTPTVGSGTFTVNLAPVSSRTADGNTFIDFTFSETISGLYSGTRIGQGSLVIHSDSTVVAHVSGVFTGTVAGSAPGTAILKGEAAGTFSNLIGQVQPSDGTQGLAGIHGQAFVIARAVSSTTLVGRYSARVQFSTP